MDTSFKWLWAPQTEVETVVSIVKKKPINQIKGFVIYHPTCLIPEKKPAYYWCSCHHRKGPLLAISEVNILIVSYDEAPEFAITIQIILCFVCFTFNIILKFIHVY